MIIKIFLVNLACKGIDDVCPEWVALSVQGFLKILYQRTASPVIENAY